MILQVSNSESSQLAVLGVSATGSIALVTPGTLPAYELSAMSDNLAIVALSRSNILLAYRVWQLCAAVLVDHMLLFSIPCCFRSCHVTRTLTFVASILTLETTWTCTFRCRSQFSRLLRRCSTLPCHDSILRTGLSCTGTPT